MASWGQGYPRQQPEAAALLHCCGGWSLSVCIHLRTQVQAGILLDLDPARTGAMQCAIAAVLVCRP